MDLDVTPLRAYMTYAFIEEGIMDVRTKRHIVTTALEGGEKSTQLLAIAMIVPFVYDSALMIKDIRKFIPADKIGYFASHLYNELHATGSELSARMCYSEFKKEINVHIAALKKAAPPVTTLEVRSAKKIKKV